MVLFNILSVMMKCETNLLFFGLGDMSYVNREMLKLFTQTVYPSSCLSIKLFTVPIFFYFAPLMHYSPKLVVQTC